MFGLLSPARNHAFKKINVPFACFLYSLLCHYCGKAVKECRTGLGDCANDANTTLVTSICFEDRIILDVITLQASF